MGRDWWVKQSNTWFVRLWIVVICGVALGVVIAFTLDDDSRFMFVWRGAMVGLWSGWLLNAWDGFMNARRGIALYDAPAQEGTT